jgi:hypothetical protein
MKRVYGAAIAVACLVALTAPVVAGPMCGQPLPVIEKVESGRQGPQRLNDVVAQAFLTKFNNTGPQTNFKAPVWVVDHPDEKVVEVMATSEGRGCLFVAPGHLRDVILKMIYGDVI